MNNDDYMRREMYRMMAEREHQLAYQVGYRAQDPLGSPPKPVAPPKPARVVPNIGDLARALFETDERVLAHVRLRAESSERMPRTMQIAWDLNVGTLRSQAQDRAAAILKAWTTLPTSVAPGDAPKEGT